MVQITVGGNLPNDRRKTLVVMAGCLTVKFQAACQDKDGEHVVLHIHMDRDEIAALIAALQENKG